MNIVELYQQTSVGRHKEIVISGDRVLLDGEECAIAGGGKLKLVRSSKGLERDLTPGLVAPTIRVQSPFQHTPLG